MEINSLNFDLSSTGGRLKAIRDAMGFTQEAFGRLFIENDKPIDKSTISKYEKNLKDISKKIQLELSSTFGISLKWLLEGKGDADLELRKALVIAEAVTGTPAQSEGDRIRYEKATKPRHNRKVPVLGEAVAGTQQELNTVPEYTDQYIDVGDLLRDSEAAFTVYGNSMTPAYPPGCVVGLKRNYDGFIMPGETYVLETASNRVFKRLYWNKEKTAYECYSDNKMIEDSGERKGKFFYEMFEVPKEAVIRLFDVTGMIKRNRNSTIVEKR